MPKIACPHCGGSKFNAAVLEYVLQPVRAEEDGSLTEGACDEGIDCQSGANTILVCHGCDSDFPLPVGTRTQHDESLKHDMNEPSGPTGPRIGAEVFWLALTEEDLARLLRDYAVTPKEPIAQRMRVLDRLRQRQPLVVICPTDPQPGVAPEDDIGCGSTDVQGPDSEGLYDCRNCGIFFTIDGRRIDGGGPN